MPLLTSTARPAVRIGDEDVTHCDEPFRLGGSPNVWVNGIPWSRQTDLNTVHLLPCGCPPCCCDHDAPITVGSITVRINGLGAGRTGDSITGCTFAGMGSPNVWAGG